MEKHLICLDLDGTLLNDEKHISPFTKKVLHYLKKSGHEIIISTGRPYRASVDYYNAMNMNTPIINFNGAYIHHPTDNRFPTKHEQFDSRIAYKIFKDISQLDIKNIIAEVKDQVYINNYDQSLFEGFSMGNPEIKYGELDHLLPESPTSLLIQAEESEIPRIKRHLNKYYAEFIEHRRWGAPFPVIEIVKKGINKGKAVKYVAEYLEIDFDNIIAFGDEDNDFEMIQFANYGIAMGNAIPELKEIATEVTDTNNNDGIGKYLNKHFNLNM